MSRLILFGAGKVGEVLYRHITASGTHEVVAFAADAEHAPPGAEFLGLPVVPFETVQSTHPPATHEMLIAIGYQNLNAMRRRKYDDAKAKGYRLASYVSPRAGVGNWLHHGENCIVLDNATTEPGVTLGNDVVIWSGALIGHHTTIEDHAWIAGHAVFGGSARLGAGSFVGLGAIVGNDVEIGERSFVGAGVLLTKCCGPKSVFIAPGTERFRLDSDQFLRITKLH
jgi:sugar O-acyltransferase (sialic acid O-acetyltransferase NeuD family)